MSLFCASFFPGEILGANCRFCWLTCVARATRRVFAMPKGLETRLSAAVLADQTSRNRWATIRLFFKLRSQIRTLLLSPVGASLALERPVNDFMTPLTPV